jgi:hypothetical protein
MRYLKLGLMIGGLIVGIHIGADLALMVTGKMAGMILGAVKQAA